MPILRIPFDRDVAGDSERYRCVSSAQSMLSAIRTHLASFRKRSEEMEDEFRYRYNWLGFKGAVLAKELEDTLSSAGLGWVLEKSPAPAMRLRTMELSYESPGEIELAQSAEGLREFIAWHHDRLIELGETQIRWGEAREAIESQLLAFQVSKVGILPPVPRSQATPSGVRRGGDFNWS